MFTDNLGRNDITTKNDAKEIPVLAWTWILGIHIKFKKISYLKKKNKTFRALKNNSGLLSRCLFFLGFWAPGRPEPLFGSIFKNIWQSYKNIYVEDKYILGPNFLTQFYFFISSDHICLVLKEKKQ